MSYIKIDAMGTVQAFPNRCHRPKRFLVKVLQ